MWRIEFKAKNKKAAHAAMNDDPQHNLMPADIVVSVHTAIDDMPKLPDGKGIFVLSQGHTGADASRDYSASLSVVACDLE